MIPGSVVPFRSARAFGKKAGPFLPARLKEVLKKQ